MTEWLALLAGSLAFGACIVAAMVLPRHSSLIAAIIGFAGLITSASILGTLSSRYSTPIAIGAGVVALIAGIVLGYTIAASCIQHLPRQRDIGALTCPEGATGACVILLSCADAERYDPRVLAYRQNLLREDADVELPLTALPFVFLTEKARYRAVGGVAPSTAVARSLAEKVDALIHGAEGSPTIRIASCGDPDGLARTARTEASAGASTIAVVVLGPPESAALERAISAIPPLSPGRGAPAVIVARTIWHDSALVRKMTDRILACAPAASRESVGVALVSAGMPDAWERAYAGTLRAENYFNQRVRLLLSEEGIAEDHIRIAWLDWQAPDVTEVVRHLAALGCRHIIVAPSTTVLPTLGTALDLEREASYARVPVGVRVVTLGAWGDDDVMASAIRDAGLAALERGGSRC